MKMINFGISAFLRIVNMTEKPQRREVRKRLFPSSTTGYDFHKRMRRDCVRHFLDGVPIEELVSQSASIKKLAERNAANIAFGQLKKWRESYSDIAFGCSTIKYESPSGLFSIKFEPQFGYQFGPNKTAIHIWNTQKPPLSRNIVGATLSLFADAYPASEGIGDIAVLSLRDRQLFRLSELAGLEALADAIVTRIENLIEEEGSTGPSPPSPSPPAPLFP